MKIKLLTLITACTVSTTSIAAEPQDLKDYAAKANLERPIEVYETIVKVASIYDVDPYLMVTVGIVESNLNQKAKSPLNGNGTFDIGMFQINSKISKHDCQEFNIYNLKGNAMCAAKLLSVHKKAESFDKMWQARYNSKTPTKKKAYYAKLEAVVRRIAANDL